MQINLLKSKIHNATVTEANLYYMGSITIDKAIMEKVGLYANEKVLVVNINNGMRIETYIIEGIANSGVFCLNGSCARHFHIGDKIIIMSFCWLSDDKIQQHAPKIVILEQNKICNILNHEPENYRI